MALNYREPGLTISETLTDSVAPLIATPDDVCLIGYVPATQNVTSPRLTLSGIYPIDLNVPLDSTNFDITKVETRNILTAPDGYNRETGYVSPTSTQTPTTPTTSQFYFKRTSGTSTSDYQVVFDNAGLISDQKSVYIQRKTTAVGTLAADISASAKSGINITLSPNSTLPTSNGSILVYKSDYSTFEVIDYSTATSTNEVQVLTGGGSASGGTFTLTMNKADWQTTITSATVTTQPLTYNATDLDVQTKLEALSYIGGGNVTVVRTGASAPYTYTITFQGALAGRNVTQLTVASSLTGTSPTLTPSTTTAGAFTITACLRGQGGTQAFAHTAGSSVEKALGTGIANGEQVDVTWQFTAADHWKPKVYRSHSKIVEKFGKPFTEDEKEINSPISLAAMLAINNGAKNVWVQPLFRGSIDNPAQPSNEDPTDVNGPDWELTLQQLQSVDNIGVIVPVVGQNASINDQKMVGIFSACQKYTESQLKIGQNYVIVVAGEDGTYSSTLGQPVTLQGHSKSLNYDQQFVLVSPTKFQTSTSSKNNRINIGGQYAAAAVAGKMVSLAASKTMTRKAITGFIGIPDRRSKDQKNADAEAGLLVIEDTGVIIQVRHGITTAGGAPILSASQSEISVVRAKQKMVASLVETIDQQIIGQIVADGNAELVIESTIRGVLQTLVDDKHIVGFNNVVAETKSYNPTIIAVSFNYRPAFPVNYVDITFAVDITNNALINTNQI